MWAKFFEQGDGETFYLPTFDEVESIVHEKGFFVKIECLLETAQSVYHKIPKRGFFGKPIYFNIDVFKKRIRLSIETFLGDANQRGKSPVM